MSTIASFQLVYSLLVCYPQHKNNVHKTLKVKLLSSDITNMMFVDVTVQKIDL